jgi:hypothetical protein
MGHLFRSEQCLECAAASRDTLNRLAKGERVQDSLNTIGSKYKICLCQFFALKTLSVGSFWVRN